MDLSYAYTWTVVRKTTRAARRMEVGDTFRTAVAVADITQGYPIDVIRLTDRAFRAKQLEFDYRGVRFSVSRKKGGYLPKTPKPRYRG